MFKSLRAKLATSFGVIFFILVLATGSNLYYVNQVNEVQDRVIKLRFETVKAGKDINNGINSSLAALRGYMILGGDPAKGAEMKKQRAAAWLLIEKSIATFNAVSVNWTVPKNLQTFAKLKKVLVEFKEAQQLVEEVAQHKSNIASYQVLLVEAAPRAAKILSTLTGIIDLEEQQYASKGRKAMLIQLANSRGSFAIGLANIRAYLLSGDQKFKELFEQKWQTNEKAYQLIEQNYRNLLSPEQQTLWQVYKQYRAEFSTIPKTMFTLRVADDWNKANYILATQAAPKATLAVDYLKQMQASQNALLQSDEETLQSSSAMQVTILLIGACSSLLISILVAIWFSNDLISRLNPVLRKALDISKNNLSTPELVIKGRDEIAVLTDAVNQMNRALIDTLSTTAESMQGVSNEANNIYIANTNMSKTIGQQNEQISLIAAAIEELSASSLEVSNSSEDTAQSAASSLENAEQGGELVNNSLQQMNEISVAFNQSAESINSLSEQSAKVEGILGVIRGIAEQTNLLALNAAIEAARAGESGRGFAVVADEVRQLASRTTEATTEIETAIDKMRTDADIAVKSIDAGRDKVQHGKEISNQVSEMLQLIIGSATDVSDKVQQIASNSNEQSIVTAEIAENTNQASSLSLAVSEGIGDVVEMTKMVSEDSSNRADNLLKMLK
ncbi:MAG: hypothetical protein OFPII_19410 [Osedax symbiont Rs1]|nr:MAG: hypothetical protein OFPII_19410 [Osedax symbiont Rs1]